MFSVVMDERAVLMPCGTSAQRPRDRVDIPRANLASAPETTGVTTSVSSWTALRWAMVLGTDSPPHAVFLHPDSMLGTPASASRAPSSSVIQVWMPSFPRAKLSQKISPTVLLEEKPGITYRGRL